MEGVWDGFPGHCRAFTGELEQVLLPRGAEDAPPFPSSPIPSMQTPTKPLFSSKELSRDASRWLPSPRQKAVCCYFPTERRKRSFSRLAKRSCPGGCWQAGKIPARKSLGGSLGMERGGEIQLADKNGNYKGIFPSCFLAWRSDTGISLRAGPCKAQSQQTCPLGAKPRKPISSFK